jgi:CheY-like chemotaxis protein
MMLADPVRLRVLIVEDHPDAAEVLSLMVRLWGHMPTVVRTGTAALEAVRMAAPDVALVDIHVPELNGYQLLEQLRQEGLEQESVWIAMTGFSDEDYRSQSTAHGFHEHLVKPLDPVQLQDLLCAVAQQRSGATVSDWPAHHRRLALSDCG